MLSSARNSISWLYIIIKRTYYMIVRAMTTRTAGEGQGSAVVRTDNPLGAGLGQGNMKAS